MSPPISEYFKVQSIPNAGRGVVASQRIQTGTVILDSEAPAAHVIFRPYRKEVCAHCFEYDRGRTLSTRDNATGKVFCSDRCQSRWLEVQTNLGTEAWQALHQFVQTKSKAITNVSSVQSEIAKPDRETITNAWIKAERQAQLHLQQALSPRHPGTRANRKPKNKLLNQPWANQVDANILGFLLAGVLFHYHDLEQWQEDLLCLAMDEEPYKSAEDLEAHCNSFVQLSNIIPNGLSSSCAATICRTLASAASHNAFGIRSGSEDGEEYMGYALYLSPNYFNHSCTPNILKRRIGSSWEFQTARDVQPGEECCITYLGGDEKDLTVAERKSRLREVWGFECVCERCQRESAGSQAEPSLSKRAE